MDGCQSEVTKGARIDEDSVAVVVTQCGWHTARIVRSNGDWCIDDSGHAEDFAIALDVCRGAQGLLKIVGKFDSRSALGFIEFANQTERIKGTVTVRVAIAKIVGE